MATPTTVTFNNDILPMIGRWAPYMTWRLDLTNYNDVKMNADVIYAQISQGNMPPPNMGGPLTPEQIATFNQWIQQGCPEN